MGAERLTPEQAQDLPLPSWLHPLQRDRIIRGHLEALGFVELHPRHLALYALRSELVAAAEMAAVQQESAQQSQEEQGELING